ncbi:putative PurR-regulated permease PerM [Neisseria sp. HSC-16F19]|nr:AI-2E family transporter [Neisseria sp. HSC-16F19]MCP2041527.1 putative PurR-regulated permease PerM [Neisseria sp. HSC-16F19]
MNTTTPRNKLQTIVYLLLLVILGGWLLHIGQSLLIPIITALISVYILVAATDKLGTLPGFRHLPEWLRRLLVLVVFLAVSALLLAVVIATGEQMVAAAPKYQHNLQNMVGNIAAQLGLESLPDWRSVRAATLAKINLQAVLGGVLGSVGSLLGLGMMVVIYAAFLMGERGSFAHKLEVAFPGEDARRTRQVMTEVNRKIGTYLATKTLINLILGVLSWLVLWFFGVDFAVFWALLIALLNYIPYVGSILGVVFPVVLSLAQFGSLATTLWLTAWLTAAQFSVGNILEPKMIGKQVNLSPFVVLVALSVWSSLWGIAGAILAIPLTSVIAIVCAVSPTSRPLAVLLVDDVDAWAEDMRRQDEA